MFKVTVLQADTLFTIKSLHGVMPDKRFSSDIELTKDEGQAYHVDLINLQKAGAIALEVTPEAPADPEIELTPEQKAERIEAIKLELTALGEEMKTADPERKVEIKTAAGDLRAEAKKLKA